MNNNTANVVCIKFRQFLLPKRIFKKVVLDAVMQKNTIGK